MPTPLRVLIVEDNEQDALLLLRELKQGGYDPVFERVQTPEAMGAALNRQAWDIVISDFTMPRFGAAAALAMVKEKGLDLPFIIVSGTVGEETAVASMRAGAHDFMPKDALGRLLPAIAREVREARNRAERKKMHDQLLISERMASVGTLAASVAHEINNPLTVLVGNLELVAERLEALSAAVRLQGAPAAGSAENAALTADRLAARLAKVEAPLQDAVEAAERVRLITRDLKVFSRAGDEEKLGPVELRSVLDSAIRMASTEIRHRAALTKNFGEVPAVEGNESRLGQVFLNLIVNAAQAIPEGRADSNEIRIATRLDAAGQVAVEIADTGQGIPPEILSHIFEPFFTTKPAGIGTGLGLAICHRIVTGMGGEISVESQVGKGSVFRIVLPRAQAAVAPAGPAAPGAIEARRGRILVVDDEPMVCVTVQRILGDAHDVATVIAARKALDMIAAGQRFDLILCDLMMPEMTGMDLHAELLRRAPDQAAKMVFMTGGAFTQRARAHLNQVDNPVIEKPFTRASFQRVVQELLR